MATENSAGSSAPWYAAYPAPRNPSPISMQREDVLEMIMHSEAGKDFILVDLRRNDHDVCLSLTNLWSVWKADVLRAVRFAVRSTFLHRVYIL
jgi:hypothetical protein